NLVPLAIHPHPYVVLVILAAGAALGADLDAIAPDDRPLEVVAPLHHFEAGEGELAIRSGNQLQNAAVGQVHGGRIEGPVVLLPPPWLRRIPAHTHPHRHAFGGVESRRPEPRPPFDLPFHTEREVPPAHPILLIPINGRGTHFDILCVCPEGHVGTSDPPAR